MDVSVIIPTYNRPRLLRETLDSVLSQTVAPREIILVDNGTSDDARLMVEAYYGSAITYLKAPPEGVQAARNAGIARAEGAWVATLDDDDRWHTDYLEQVGAAAADGRASLIYCDFRKFFEEGDARKPPCKTNFEMAPARYWDGIPGADGASNWSFVGSFPAERLLHFVAFYPSTMTVRRDLVNAIGGFNRDMFGIKSEDMEFTARALLAGQLAIVWKPLTDYRIHDANSCAADWISQAIGRWKIFEYIYARDGYGSAPFRRALEEDLPRRRAHMFDQAWRHSRFAASDELEQLLRPDDWTWMRRIRHAVRHAPPPLRTAAMRTRQLLSELGSTGTQTKRQSWGQVANTARDSVDNASPNG